MMEEILSFLVFMVCFFLLKMLIMFRVLCGILCTKAHVAAISCSIIAATKTKADKNQLPSHLNKNNAWNSGKTAFRIKWRGHIKQGKGIIPECCWLADTYCTNKLFWTVSSLILPNIDIVMVVVKQGIKQ